MTLQIVDARELLSARSRVLSRAECLRRGIKSAAIQRKVQGDRWRRLHRGVYALHSGEPDRAVQMWGALLRAGDGAIFSHQTAAEIHGFLGRPSPLIHITVPVSRNPARQENIPGVVIHRSGLLELARHPGSVPCTRVEDTVLDLIAASGSFDAKFDWICRAVGKRLTTPERLLESLRKRTRLPGRRDVELMLGYAAEGIMSWLELEWVKGVERPHGLPAARRQVRVRQGTGNRYLDNLYEDYRVCVELDGRAAHPESEQRHDNARDRWNLVHEKIVTMRFRVPDLSDQRRKCAAAADVASVLSDRAGSPVGTPCGTDCPVG